MSLKVSFPPELRAKVEAAAQASDGSLGGEIKRRVEWTFSLEPTDEPTRSLIEAIALMAADVERETGTPWHSHPGSHLAFRQAISGYLAALRPREGLFAFGPRPHQADPSDDPEEIGLGIQQQIRFGIERGWGREEREESRLFREKNLRELMEFHHQRKPEGGND
jgi:hypothetical protein